MNYKVLYRKYRPNNFENLIGQNNIVTILKNSIKSEKISHAYIFSGPRGTGKTSSAKIFAKTINCLEPKDGISCDKCNNCLNYDNTNDIIEIDAASNNGVDEIREITNNIKLMPNLLKYKVYIIDEVHMLTTSAFNALLLTLEEPPSHVIFILATTNIESVPITILSRCQRFDFRKITIDDIKNRLKHICDLEKIKITDDALDEIANLSDGGMRDSLSLLDQLSKETEEITIENVLKSTGNLSEQKINQILDLLESNNSEELINIINDLDNLAIDYKLFIKKMIESCSFRVKTIVLDQKIERLDIKEYKSLILDLTNLINQINISVNPFSLILVTLLTYVDINIKVNTKNIVENVQNNVDNSKKIIENTEKTEIIEKNSQDIAETSEDFTNIKDIRVNNCFVGVSKDEKISSQNMWENLKKNVKTTLKGLIIDTNIEAASKDIIVISGDYEELVNDLNKNLLEIEKEFNDNSDFDKKLIFITKSEWKKYSEEYINSIKSGKKYKYIEEINVEKEEDDNLDDIFDVNKIEER